MNFNPPDFLGLEIRDIKRKSKFFWMRTLWFSKKYRQKVLLGIILLVSLSYVFWGMPPLNFPVGIIIEVKEGASLNEIAKDLDNRNIIKSQIIFKALIALKSGQGGAMAGDYLFSEKKDIFRVSNMIARGEHGLTPMSITIPEGSTVVEMAVIYERILGGFNAETFVHKALPFEGYLFPDTYFFLPNVKEQQIIDVMKENFVNKLTEIQSVIDVFGKSLEDIVIMASLLEKEASRFQVRRMVSGILWNRIDIGMLLQVDAVFPYIIGKNTFQVTLDDLKFESSYNTYKYPGLPSGPIANPGLLSLRAAADPIKTDYIFYLSDLDSNMHYARTFEEHKRNKRMYLD